ncbi:MAG: membrane protein insertase YidC [Planctomycetota bacterium]|nr:membrane protein insertase YidC [Planctomycetota bacterium]
MDKRFLQTMLICFAISFIYMDWIRPPSPQPSPSPETVASNPQQPAAVISGAPASGASASDDAGISPAPVSDEPLEEQLFSLSNEELELEISNRGAVLTRAILPAYREEVGSEDPLQLISQDLLSGNALELQVPSLGVDLGQRVWQVVESTDNSVTFRTDLAAGRGVVRHYSLPDDGYELFTSVTFEGDWPVATDIRYELLGAKRIRYDVSGRAASYPNQWVVAPRNRQGQIGEVEHLEVEAVESGEIRKDGIAWAGLESNYFAQVIRPLAATQDSPAPSLALLAYGVRPGERTAEFEDLASVGIAGRPLQGWPLQVGYRRKIEPATLHEYAVFLGPKSPIVLDQHEDWGATELIDYGFFGWLVSPFLWLLRTFDGLVGSWGLSIVLLTFCIRGVLHPVNKKNQRQMQIQQQGMARLKPQMDEIKERYKNDAPKQQRKIQELFKSEGVNPAAMFGGCLFIFLQLPIWLALINTFTIAIELRQASFLWIDDLTRPDMLAMMPFSLPFLGNYFNILPILYVIVTLVNQKMMPQSEDPQAQAQQKMMSFMMIAFGFIFYSFAAGLMIYFITSALIGIFEQKMIRRDLRAAGILPAQGATREISGPGGSTQPSPGPAGPGGSKGSGSKGNGRSGKGKVNQR